MWENKPVQETHQWDELRSLILRMWAFPSCLWPQFVSKGCKWLPRLTDSWEADHIGCTGEVWFVNEPLRTWVNRVIQMNGSQNCFELYIHEWDWINVSSSRVNNSLSVADYNTLRICTDFDEAYVLKSFRYALRKHEVWIHPSCCHFSIFNQIK